MSYLWVLDNFCVLKMYFACKGTIKWAKCQRKWQFFFGNFRMWVPSRLKKNLKGTIKRAKKQEKFFFFVFPSESTFFLSLGFAKATKSSMTEEVLCTITCGRYCYMSFSFPVRSPFTAYPIFIHRLARSTPIRYPFNVLSTLFRGHKNVSSPIFSGTWVGDEWDMSGTHIGEKDSKFPLFFLCFPFVLPCFALEKVVKRRWWGNESSWKWQRRGRVIVDISMNIHSCWHPSRAYHQW